MPTKTVDLDEDVTLLSRAPRASWRASLGRGAPVAAPSGEEPEDATEIEGNCTFAQATVNFINYSIGSTILAMPWAISQAGIATAYGTFAIAVLLAGSTAWMLVECQAEYARRFPRIPAPFSTLAEYSIGGMAGYLVAVGLYADLFFSCVMFVITGGTALHRIALPEGSPIKLGYVIYAGAVAVAALVRDMSRVSFLSLLGASTTLLLFSVLVYYAAESNAFLKPHPGVNLTYAGPTWVKAIGTYMFGLPVHVIFPSMRRTMAEPERFGKSVAITLTCVVVSLAAFGLVGYLTHGDTTLDLINQNFPAGTVSFVCQVFIGVTAFTKYIVVFNPLMATPEQKLAAALPRVPWIVRHCAFRWLVVGLTLLVAVALPAFNLLLDLVGALVGTLMVGILPTLMYERFFAAYISLPMRVACVAVRCLGVALGLASVSVIVLHFAIGY
eukprot:TRINITY_DN14572_c0_g1_i1.p1 TRINITY_DN14572_c0_g1~~TRINITY_DN14572_c0_g1_i1.p1  ORF type:complete len:455 (-),score=71.19 TRINITY_DN14572_c0_g1_i1:234-1559(-)